jgi:perosamine synthetase
MSEPSAIAATDEFIPVYKPDLSGNEKSYVARCLDSGWVSSLGEYIDRFETAFSHTTNLPHTISVSNGTVALHLAFHALGLGPGDEVIVPTFTYVASVNTIVQTGATPVFVDCRPGDWLIDPQDVIARITPRTRAIVAVHLYGAVCDVAALRRIADDHGLYLVEDCAEALGSTRDGRHVGELADAATFSFFGNKTVTTGEGGMIGVSDPGLADRIRLLKGQAQSPTRRYWHVELGFNYRMTNICAAIGLAQLERLPEILARKRRIARLYRRYLAEAPVRFQEPEYGVESSEWLVTLLLPKGIDRDGVIESMRRRRIDTRPTFYCAHEMPMYASPHPLATSREVSAHGLSLPSYPSLTDEDVRRVAETLRSVLAGE